MRLAVLLLLGSVGFAQNIQTVNNESMPTARTKINSNFSIVAPRHYLDVTNYGASPSLADNSSAFAAAFADAASKNIGNVFIPGGTFKVCSTVDIPNKVRIFGNGRGDSDGPNTTIQACPTFSTTAGGAVVRVGTNVTTDAHFGSGLSEMSIDANGRSPVGILFNFAEEQTQLFHVTVYNASDSGIRLMGADKNTGASQNNDMWRDLEIFPGIYATSSTTCIDIENAQDFRGIQGLSCVPQTGYALDHGIIVSGNNITLIGIHIEFSGTNNGSAIYVGPASTQGMVNLTILSADCTTGCSGPVVEIYGNTTNAPANIFLNGIYGGAHPICDDTLDAGAGGYCGHTEDSGIYFIGNGAGNSAGRFGLNPNSLFKIFSPVYINNSLQLQSSSNSLTFQYPGGIFAGFEMGVNTNGDLILGYHGAKSAGNVLLDNPFKGILIGPSDNGNGLNLFGAVSDTNNPFKSFVCDAATWDTSAKNFKINDNGSGSFACLGYLASGGMGLYAATGLTTPGTLSEASMSADAIATFTPTGTVIPALKSTTGTRYVCVDTTGKLVSSATACSGT